MAQSLSVPKYITIAITFKVELVAQSSKGPGDSLGWHEILHTNAHTLPQDGLSYRVKPFSQSIEQRNGGNAEIIDQRSATMRVRAPPHTYTLQ